MQKERDRRISERQISQLAQSRGVLNRPGRDADGDAGSGHGAGGSYGAGSDGGAEAASRGDSNSILRKSSMLSAAHQTGMTANRSGRSYQSAQPQNPSGRSTQRSRIPLSNERGDRPEYNEDLVMSTDDSRVLPSGAPGATRGAGPTGGGSLGI